MKRADASVERSVDDGRQRDEPRPSSIRRVFLFSMVTVTALTALLAVALVVTTTIAHRATADIATAVNGVRAAEEATIALLLHARSSEPMVRRDLEANLRERLSELEAALPDEEESAALRETVAITEGYFAAEARSNDMSSAEAQALLNDAFLALQHLVELNSKQAQSLEARLARWASVASAFGIAVAACAVALVIAVLSWQRARLLGPVLAFFNAMERFGSGERQARAPVEGPVEVRLIARRFNDMADALARQEKAQHAFLAGVAHDFRNPVSALSLAIHGLRDDAPLPPEPRLRQTLALVRRTVARLDRMLGDLVDRARIAAADLELRWEVVDARELVRTVVDLYRDTSRRHRLEVIEPDEPVPLWCDPMRIEQVLTNLVSNAIKYSPQGGPVTLRVSANDERVLLSVQDRGLGMAATEIEAAFAPFQRSTQLSADIPGSGLGLSVVQRIVAAHQGRIHVDSTPGAGSTFVVELPRAAS